MGKFVDLSGQRFGRLTVLGRGKDVRFPSGGMKVRWRCRCDCGGRFQVFAGALTKGETSSCGCLQKERASTSNKTHGQSGTAEHHAWHAMWSRCTNPNQACWKNYGGRGIRVHPRWKSFEKFFSDVGPKPSPKHTLERRNNARDYEPGNVYWATRREQNRNKRTTRFLTFKGQTLAFV